MTEFSRRLEQKQTLADYEMLLKQRVLRVIDGSKSSEELFAYFPAVDKNINVGGLIVPLDDGIRIGEETMSVFGKTDQPIDSVPNREGRNMGTTNFYESDKYDTLEFEEYTYRIKDRVEFVRWRVIYKPI